MSKREDRSESDRLIHERLRGKTTAPIEDVPRPAREVGSPIRPPRAGHQLASGDSWMGLPPADPVWELPNFARAHAHLQLSEFCDRFPTLLIVVRCRPGRDHSPPLSGQATRLSGPDGTGVGGAQGVHEWVYPLAPRSERPSEFVTIGRAEANDIVIDHPVVSKRHVMLRLRGGLWSVIDCGSTNGTLLDGVPLVAREAIAVQDGSRLELGLAVELDLLHSATVHHRLRVA